MKQNTEAAEMMTITDNELSIKAFLSAADCNAQQEMSLPLLTQKLIDVATAHANHLGVGYERLIKDNRGWVLSRLSIEAKRFPAIDEWYTLTTWVENVNRRFSERIIEIRDGADEVIGYARLVWVVIDITTRRACDISDLIADIHPSGRRCPIDSFPRLAPITDPGRVTPYQFRYCDIDFNRHVNSTRYIEAMLNEWSVDFFDRKRISRFDIAYHAETLYGQLTELRMSGDDQVSDIELTRDGAVSTRARFCFSPR